MSSTQDVRFSDGFLEEGRKLANKLWNVARLILAQRGGGDAGGAAVGARGAVDPGAAVRVAAARSRRRSAELDFAEVASSALPPHLRRLLRLVRGGDQAAALRRRRRRAGDRARGARAAAEAAPPGDAARDRGDLVEPAGAGVAADRRAVAGGRRRRRRPARSSACRKRPRPSGAAACSSRSRATRSGSSTSSSSPSGRRRTGTPTPSASGCARRSRGPRGCSRTTGSCQNAPAEVVEAEREKLERYRRELDAISGSSD